MKYWRVLVAGVLTAIVVGGAAASIDADLESDSERDWIYSPYNLFDVSSSHSIHNVEFVIADSNTGRPQPGAVMGITIDALPLAEQDLAVFYADADGTIQVALASGSYTAQFFCDSSTVPPTQYGRPMGRLWIEGNTALYEDMAYGVDPEVENTVVVHIDC